MMAQKEKFRYRRLLIYLIFIIAAVISVYAGFVFYHLWQAGQALAAGDYSAAGNEMVAAARLFPWNVRFWERAGMYALKAGEVEKAVEILEHPALDTLSFEGIQALSSAYQQQEDFPAAVQLLNSALDLDLDHAAIYSLLYEVHRNNADYPAAIADLEALLQLKPEDATSRYHLGLLLAATQPSAAIDVLSLAGEQAPDLQPTVKYLVTEIRSAMDEDNPAYLLVTSGRALAAIGEWQLASHAFTLATQADPAYAEAWAFLGEALQQQNPGEKPGTSRDGLTELEKAVTLDPASIAANTLLALYWKRHDDPRRGIEYLTKAIDLQPANPTLLIELGGMYALIGDFQSAYQSFQKAALLSPASLEYQKIPVRFCIENRFRINDICLAAATRLVSRYPQDAEARDLLGQLNFLNADWGAAERNYKIAIALDSQYAPAFLHLGWLYLETGDLEQAREVLQQAISLAPGSPEAEEASRLIQVYIP